ncbi:hypothetical protein NJLHNGOC_10905 [Novacetimonas cocois]|uniref:Uncharacterized protein n=1 Tax=Novacetimonas cocois TaxID=1747507 RepID=A0A365YVL3_9PROT|nr:hypothetical protein NJLHNGOC_10905 [Novacetimonas cocois]
MIFCRAVWGGRRHRVPDIAVMRDFRQWPDSFALSRRHVPASRGTEPALSGRNGRARNASGGDDISQGSVFVAPGFAGAEAFHVEME